jgi:hypothetical protein
VIKYHQEVTAMTVSELIKELEKYDKDQQVAHYNGCSCNGVYEDEEDTDENGKKYVILG